MTEHQPDDLYDALRDRLADYGQEPPAPLWANIRAQLPPPVATPQRQWARSRWLAALALLLVGVSSWQWWQPGRRRHVQAGHLATHVSSAHPAPVARPPAGGAAAATHPRTTAAAPDNRIRQASDDALVHSATAAGGAIDGSETKPAATKDEVASASSHSLPAAAAFIPALRPRALGTGRAAESGNGVAAAVSSKSGIDTLAATTPTPGFAVARHGLTGGSDFLLTARLPGSAGNATTRRASVSGRQNAARAAQPGAPAPGEQQLASMLAETLAETTRKMPQRATRETWPLALPHLTALLLQPFPAPAPLVRADTLPPLPVAAVRRWAVQVLAGPALTSRTLSTRQLAATPATAYSPNNPTRDKLSTSSPENERAALGFGAEVQLQRQLNGRWSLGSGLGYQAFATNQPVQVRVVSGPSPTGPFPASNFLPDSMSTVSVRNTYHFLTLPLRVGYQLGAGHVRLRYGLRAGADVAFYLGGRSTEGSTNGSTSRSWGASGSPYRPFSLALSVGAEVRYRLAPGWELLAQPTFTHFLTSVAQPASGYVPRYPLAGTVLVGVAYWLH